MPIEYDPSRTALYSPAQRPTLFASASDYSKVQLGIECARLAYLDAESVPAEAARLSDALGRVGFAAPVLFGRAAPGTQGFGAYRARDKLAVLAFRGTQPEDIADIAADLEVQTVRWSTGGRVHGGFAEAFASVTTSVDGWLTQTAARAELLVCGHSLGAALANLAATRCRTTHLVTIGAPRVGDAAFVSALAGIDITRIIDCCDVVARVPPETPWYTHAGRPTYIDRNGYLHEDPPSQYVDRDDAAARGEYLLRYAWQIGAVLVRDLADHAPINYARAFFP